MTGDKVAKAAVAAAEQEARRYGELEARVVTLTSSHSEEDPTLSINESDLADKFQAAWLAGFGAGHTVATKYAVDALGVDRG